MALEQACINYTGELTNAIGTVYYQRVCYALVKMLGSGGAGLSFNEGKRRSDICQSLIGIDGHLAHLQSEDLMLALPQMGKNEQKLLHVRKTLYQHILKFCAIF